MEESATKAWEGQHICHGMTNDNARYRRLAFSGMFTAKGKRGTSRWIQGAWPSAADSFLLLLTLTMPAAAKTQVGSTSSESVGISVSVVPSFTLASSEPLDKSINPASYCIAINGQPMALPVLLVQANDGNANDRSADPLPRCEAGKGGPLHQTHVNDRERLRLLIIRPE